jgi:hypothetical protein
VEFTENSKMEKNIMLQWNAIFAQLKCKSVARFAVPVLFALSLACSSTPIFAQEPGQQTFVSPEDAGRAFFAAMQAPMRTLAPDSSSNIRRCIVS